MKRTGTCRGAIALIGIALLATVCGCGGRRDRVIVLGLDGLDPGAVATLTAEGRLPNLSRCLEIGASGTLHADEPLLSPVLWTTMATGRPPDVHGIGGFQARHADDGEQLPVSGSERRVPALWNITSQAGLQVGVVGWWATWPPEHVRGTMVSDRTCYHFLLAERGGDDSLKTAVWPPAAASWIRPLLQRPEDVTAADLGHVADLPESSEGAEFSFTDDLQHLRWALATANSYSRIGLELWRRQSPDLLMVYIEAPDTVSHLFGHLYRAPQLAGELAEQQKRFGRTVERVYQLVDGIVGEFLAGMDSDTTLLVMSDHGFKLGQLGPREAVPGGDPRRVSERSHEPEGFLVMAGRGIQPGSRINGARQLDIAPTTLALLGLAAARDMPGRVLSEALDGFEIPARIATYGERKVIAAGENGAEPEGVDRALLEHLQSLGYLGGGGEGQVDRGRADMLLKAGRDEEAARAYRDLLARSSDDAGLYLNLGVALARLGRLDEAETCFDETLRIEPTNARALLNIALAHERRGETAEAVAAVRRAVQYDPGLEASRKALRRITGSSIPFDLRSDADRAAAGLAAKAAAAQSRGDLKGAAALLDEATRTAPKLAPIWEQRGMVAYLRGRLTDAESDLARSLELDPGNAMVQKNLKAVRRKLGSERHSGG